MRNYLLILGGLLAVGTHLSAVSTRVGQNPGNSRAEVVARANSYTVSDSDSVVFVEFIHLAEQKLKAGYEYSYDASKGLVLSPDSIYSNAAQFSSDPATNARGAWGELEDGGGYPALLDGDPYTYFHSVWMQAGPSAYHNLQFALSKPVSSVMLKLRERVNMRVRPQNLIIYAANDTLREDSWKEITQIQNMEVRPDSTIQEFISLNGSYRYLRFDVTRTDGNNQANGYPFFALSECQWYEAEIDSSSLNLLYPQEAAELRAAIDTAKAVGYPYPDVVERLQAAYEKYLALEPDVQYLSIQVDMPGTLGRKILEAVSDWDQVQMLKVSGTLNDDDLYCLKQNLTNLVEVDLSEAVVSHLAEYIFQGRTVLKKVILPETLQYIDGMAFQNCSIEEIELPHSLDSIGNAAFYGSKLTHIEIPEGVRSLSEQAFANCTYLKNVTVPSTVKVLSNSLFQDCRNLSVVTLSEGLERIEDYAFQYSALTQIDFPSTLKYVGDGAFYSSSLRAVVLPDSLERMGRDVFSECNELTDVTIGERLTSCGSLFTYCNNLMQVTCKAYFPPSVDEYYDWNEFPEACVLYVPEASIVDYKLARGWDKFAAVKGMDIWPEYLSVRDSMDWFVPENLPENYKPSLVLKIEEDPDYSYQKYVGTLRMVGSTPLNLSYFEMSMIRSDYSDNQYANALTHEMSIQTDSILYKLSIPCDRWSFLSFPFDVRVRDIVPEKDNTFWVIRKYSGWDRAQANMSNTWQNMTNDSILKAGEGYIWNCTSGDDNYVYSCKFIVPALKNEKMNNLFDLNGNNLVLHEYASEFSHNKNWNFVGNPYPCYYDTRNMQFGAPIMVWNSNAQNYEAYSLVDDDYILEPGEAFFVQCPDGETNMGFPVEGQMLTKTQTVEGGYMTRVAPRNNGERKVFNLILGNGKQSDRTRFVLNEKAQKEYEISCDAAKFMSSDASVPQLFMIENGVEMAINERPYLNGLFYLGYKAGSKGTYTISLNTEEAVEVILVDQEENKEVSLNENAYTFSSEAGTFTGRFLIKVAKVNEEETTTGVDEQTTDPVQVKQQNGMLSVILGSPASVEVYTSAGQMIRSEYTNQLYLNLQPGVYVIKVNGRSYKVAVAE